MAGAPTGPRYGGAPRPGIGRFSIIRARSPTALSRRKIRPRAGGDAMPDPWEGVAADGTIVTGAPRSRVPAPFEPVRADAAASVGDSGGSLYVYGSVAVGAVRPGSSDVTLVSIGLPDAAV